jgi:hypothetical protein
MILMTGNGYQAGFRIDAQNHREKAFKDLLARIWGTLRVRWNLDKLDPNKSIMRVRVPGAYNYKGLSEDDSHPYRRAELLCDFEGTLTLPAARHVSRSHNQHRLTRSEGQTQSDLLRADERRVWRLRCGRTRGVCLGLCTA